MAAVSRINRLKLNYLTLRYRGYLISLSVFLHKYSINALNHVSSGRFCVTNVYSNYMKLPFSKPKKKVRQRIYKKNFKLIGLN